MAEDKEIGSLAVKLGLDGTGFQAGVGKINQHLAVIKSELKLATAQMGGFGTSTDAIKLKADSLSKQMEIQIQKIKALDTAFEKSIETKGKDAKASYDLGIKLNNAKIALANMENELKLTNKELLNQIPNVNKLGDSFDSASKKIKSAGQTITSAGQALTIGVTAPIVGVGYAAGQASVSFETAFAGVKKTINATTEEFAGLKQGIRDMAQEIPVTVEEISHVETAAGQLGISKGNIEGFTEVMLKMGVATNLASETAATELAKVANITQMPQTQFDRLGSTIVRLGNNMATTEADIVAMDLRLAGAGHTIGLTNANTLGLSAALSSVGIEAEAGGSAFSKLMVDIASAVANGGKQLNNLAIVSGMTSEQFKKSFKTDAAGTIISFIEGLGKMQTSGQNVFGVLDTLGMSEIRMRDALLRAAGAGELFRKALDQANKGWTDNNALQKEAEQRFGTSASQLTIMKNRLRDVGITLGDVLIPVFLKALDSAEPLFNLIKDGADWFSQLPQPVQNTALALLGIAAAAGPATAALGFLTIGVGSLSGALAILTGPIGLISASVVILGGSVAVLTINWNKMTTSTKAFISTMLATFGPIGTGISYVIKLGAAGIELVRNWETTRINIARTMENMSYQFKSKMSEMYQNALQYSIKVVEGLSQITDFIPGLSAKIDTLKDKMNGMLDSSKLAQNANESEHALKQSTYALDLHNIAMERATKAEEEKWSKYQKAMEAKAAADKIAAVVPPATNIPPIVLEGSGNLAKKAEDARKKAYDAALEMAKFNAQFYNQSTAQQIAALQKVAAAHKKHLKEDIGDEHAYLLEVKKLREDVVKQAQEAEKAKFDNSKQWIASKKELNQLSEKEELAAWKRVSEQYKAGTKERIEADKEYYKLKNAMDKKAVEDKKELDKKARENTISEADKLGDAVTAALKKRYDAQEKIEIKANEKSVKDAQTASDAKIAILEKERDDSIALIDSIYNPQIAAKEAAIKALEDLSKAEDYAFQKSELEKKLAAVSNAAAIANAKQKLIDATQQKEFRAIDAKAEYEQNALLNPNDEAKNRSVLNNHLLILDQDLAKAQLNLKTETDKEIADKAIAQKALNDLVTKHDRDEKKDKLKAEIDALKASADAQKLSAEKTLKEKEKLEALSLKATTDRLSEENKAIGVHYNELTAADALAAEARRIALDKNQTELITLLGTYNPQWQNAGQSFGKSLLDGLNSTKASIQSAVNEILSLVNQAQAAQAPKLIGPILGPESSRPAINQAKSVGANVALGISAGIANGLQGVKATTGNLVTVMTNEMKAKLGIRSPSQVTMGIGEFTGQGLVLGMANTIRAIKQQARQLATAAIPGSTRFGGGSVDAPGNTSSGGGGITQVLQFAAGAIQINASDIKSMQDLISLFERLPQASRAR